MIKLHLILLGISCLLYFILFKLTPWQRIIIALASFVIPAMIITLLFIYSGDKPTPGARTIDKEMINTGGEESNREDIKGEP